MNFVFIQNRSDGPIVYKKGLHGVTVIRLLLLLTCTNNPRIVIIEQSDNLQTSLLCLKCNQAETVG